MLKKIKENILPYSVSIAISLLVGLLAALLTKDNMDIYEKLNTPPLSPPSILFPIVWTVLYVLMGISAANIYGYRFSEPEPVRRGLTFYAASLVLNFGWSIIFFNTGAYIFAFIWLLALLYSIIRTALEYKKLSLFSAILQIPYILWVAFAGYLNLGIAILN